VSDKKPRKIDVDQALTGGVSSAAGGGADDDIEIVEVVAGEPEDGAAGEQQEAEGGVQVETAAPQDADQQATLIERLKRLQAEYENYRKRVERDRVGHREQANATLVLGLLPVLDSFERALRDGSGRGGDEFRSGVELIERQLREVLHRAGLEPLRATGQVFDPEVHEAVAATYDPNVAPGKILEVFEQGYRFRGRLLRPARVRVAAANPAGDGRSGGGEDGSLAH
jgi:molecular chaperone GrpE